MFVVSIVVKTKAERYKLQKHYKNQKPAQFFRGGIEAPRDFLVEEGLSINVAQN